MNCFDTNSTFLSGRFPGFANRFSVQSCLQRASILNNHLKVHLLHGTVESISIHDLTPFVRPNASFPARYQKITRCCIIEGLDSVTM